MTPTTCRCGAPSTTTGQCTHCDRADRACTPLCAHCRQRDAFCVICRTPCGTKAAAESCERHHRGVESGQRR